jgi:hypothetical protein
MLLTWDTPHRLLGEGSSWQKPDAIAELISTANLASLPGKGTLTWSDPAIEILLPSKSISWYHIFNEVHARKMNYHPNPSYKVPKRKRLWVRGLLGVVLVCSLASPFLGRTAESPTDQKTDQVQQAPARADQSAPAAPKVGPQATTQSTTDLKSQIERVLTGIKEANQNKDLSQLLSYYSSNFPQLPQRAQSFSKNWKVYNYPKMEFEIKGIRLVAENNAVIKVTWNVEVQNISTKKSKDMSKTYLVRFIKESGQWRINALKKMD